MAHGLPGEPGVPVAEESSTDIATQDNGTTAVGPVLGDDGLTGEYNQTDIVIPSVTLVQPMSVDKGEEGTFRLQDGRNFGSLDVVVLEIASTRAMWEPRESSSDITIICKSGDRRMGYTEHPNIVFGDDALKDPMTPICTECPHADDDQFSREDYLCKFGYTLLLYEVEHQFPFLYYIKGAAMKYVKQRIVSPALLHRQQTGKGEPWRFIYHIEGKMNADGFKYWFPDIVLAKHLDEEMTERYASLSRSYRGKAGDVTVGDAESESSEWCSVCGQEAHKGDCP